MKVKRLCRLFLAVILITALIGCAHGKEKDATEDMVKGTTAEESSSHEYEETTEESQTDPEDGTQPVTETEPETKEFAITIDSLHLTGATRNYDYDVHLPRFTVTGDETLEGYLNRIIRDDLQNLLDEFIMEAETNPPSDAEGQNLLYFDFAVHLNDLNSLSISVMTTWYKAGAAHPNANVLTYNLDVLSQKTISLDDLFGAGSGYQTVISMMIKEHLDASLFKEHSFYYLSNEQLFCMTEDSIIFFFDPYTIASGVIGVVQVEIAKEDLPPPYGGGAVTFSYAYCTDFNPGTNQISFDYVEILFGEEAVAALMQDQGISESEARNIIYDHDPNEYIRNRNPRIRAFTVNNEVVFWLLYGPDGFMHNVPEGTLSTYSDFLALYVVHPDLVVGHQLYLVKLRHRVPYEIRQEYRP